MLSLLTTSFCSYRQCSPGTTSQSVPASVVTEMLDVVSVVDVVEAVSVVPASVVIDVLDVVPGVDVVEAVSVVPASVVTPCF